MVMGHGRPRWRLDLAISSLPPLPVRRMMSFSQSSPMGFHERPRKAEDRLSLDDRRNVLAYVRSLVHFQ